GVVDEEAGERVDLDVREVGDRLLQHADTLLGREQGGLGRVLEHRHDDIVEAAGGPADDVEMAVRDGVGGAGTHRAESHRMRPPVAHQVWNMSSTASP